VKTLLAQLISGQALTADQSRDFFVRVLEGSVDSVELAAMLTALAAKSPSVEELLGAAQAMQAHVTPLTLSPDGRPIDTCGTGGDGKPTINVSTAVAIVTAACGGTVAKHGNRSNQRPSGSAEVLQALGVRIDAVPTVVARCIAECGVGFLFAPNWHPAMRHAAAVRKALGIPTIFNLVGPITNPAGVRRQVLGVRAPALVPFMSEVLRRLGRERYVVVSGEEGLCDVSPEAPSSAEFFDAGRLDRRTLTARDFGIAPFPLSQVFVSSPSESAGRIMAAFEDCDTPAAQMIAMNAALALWTADLEADLIRATQRATEAIRSGAAMAKLQQWRELSARD
jgi:anthranilate phosphoribosyltransferase